MMIREKLEKLYDIGSSKRVFQSEWRSEGVPFYRAREIAKLAIDDYVDNELFIDEELYDSYVEKYGKPQPGDIMVTGVGTLGVCYIVKPDDKFYFKDGNILWFKQKAPDRILPEYLVKLFDSNDVREFISRNSSGTTVGTFTIQTAKKLEINLPSLGEQKRIIQKLAKIENIINNRKRELVLLDDCIKARFVEMFGDPVSNSLNQPILAMTDVCEIIDGDRGVNYPKQEDFYNDEYCLFLNAKNVTKKGFDFSECMFITKEKDEQLRKGKLKRGDVVLTTRGTLGNIAFYTKDIPFDNVRINSGMVILRLNRDIIDETFFIEQFRMQVDSIKTFVASGSAQPQLPISTMNKIKVLMPDLELQKQYSQIIEQINKSKVAIQKSLAETQLLFDKLMQDYFG